MLTHPARRLAALLTVGLLLAAAPARAQDPAQDPAQAMIAELQAQGYLSFEVSRTLLGRIRVLATRPEGLREIVFNPATGEILRDYWDPSADAAQAAAPGVIDRVDDGAAPAAPRPAGEEPDRGGQDRDDDGRPAEDGQGGGGQSGGGGEDHDRGHGNDGDGDDGDNPGRGTGAGRDAGGKD